jgi:hypothetical protein
MKHESYIAFVKGQEPQKVVQRDTEGNRESSRRSRQKSQENVKKTAAERDVLHSQVAKLLVLQFHISPQDNRLTDLKQMTQMVDLACSGGSLFRDDSDENLQFLRRVICNFFGTQAGNSADFNKLTCSIKVIFVADIKEASDAGNNTWLRAVMHGAHPMYSAACIRSLHAH